MQDESDIRDVDVTHEYDSDTDFVQTSSRERENFKQTELKDLVRHQGLAMSYHNYLLRYLKRICCRKKQR